MGGDPYCDVHLIVPPIEMNAMSAPQGNVHVSLLLFVHSALFSLSINGTALDRLPETRGLGKACFETPTHPSPHKHAVTSAAITIALPVATSSLEQ